MESSFNRIFKVKWLNLVKDERTEETKDMQQMVKSKLKTSMFDKGTYFCHMLSAFLIYFAC